MNCEDGDRVGGGREPKAQSSELGAQSPELGAGTPEPGAGSTQPEGGRSGQAPRQADLRSESEGHSPTAKLPGARDSIFSMSLKVSLIMLCRISPRSSLLCRSSARR